MKNKFNVFLLSFAHLTHDIYTSFLAPVLPLLIQKLGLNVTEASILDVIRRIPALFNPYLGLLISRKDLRIFTILSPSITAIFMSLIGIAPNYIILLILIFLAGISAQIFHIATPGIVKEVTPKMGFGMSMFMVGGELARTIAPLIATAAVSIWGLEGLLKTVFFAFFASAFLWWKLKDIKGDFKPKTKQKADFKIFMEYKNFFLTISAFMFFQSFAKIFFAFYLPLFLTHIGESLTKANISLSFFQFFAILGTFLAGNIGDKFGYKKTLIFSTLIAIVSMPLFIYFHLIYLPLILLGLSLFSTGPVMLSIIHHHENSTALNGVYMMLAFLIPAFVTFSIGVLSDMIGLEKVGVVSFIFLIISIIFAFKIKG
ncbi:MFS transporter, FSR family, fosmidomycin resistance protein [Lebetimonas natsushimae]|uniref:MFS transporter, FSR family, fosmidomycin resistance protein n=1 Tax=Lebetimonas natsushimae TaxID=1936991 RepID=A0A292YDA1_9BACT|nr:MFS transporter [Lebetimonas natsushimae]GAX87204.1 MFS transporter, FSR family, fosmidomycin resistance protein [Lebetimonas natsushimae]